MCFCLWQFKYLTVRYAYLIMYVQRFKLHYHRLKSPYISRRRIRFVANEAKASICKFGDGKKASGASKKNSIQAQESPGDAVPHIAPWMIQFAIEITAKHGKWLLAPETKWALEKRLEKVPIRICIGIGFDSKYAFKSCFLSNFLHRHVCNLYMNWILHLIFNED